MNLNGAQLHLLVNHFPVVGYPIVLLALLWGFFKKENQTFIFGIYLSILIFISTGISYLTGDEAEDVLRDLPDFNIHTIHTHEDTAFIALLMGSFFAVIGLCLLPVVQSKLTWLQNPKLQGRLKIGLMVGVFIICAVLALAAHQGGLVRHTEIR